MRELISTIAKALVDDPQKVKVSEIAGRQVTVFELKVAKEDLGKIIGRNGRTADAIRTLIAAISSKDRKRTVLEILE